MDDEDTSTLRAAIAALEGQRATLGDAVLELAIAPLEARKYGDFAVRVGVHTGDVALGAGIDADRIATSWRLTGGEMPRLDSTRGWFRGLHHAARRSDGQHVQHFRMLAYHAPYSP
jgi:hypothetical protein